MAIANSDGSIVLNTNVDTGGVKQGFSSISSAAKKVATTVGKAFLAIGAAATAATVAMVKQSVESYAEYEQLVGGVETLFKNSSKKVLEYANEAYKTTGQSANEYMKNVTAFSASLLSAVGGDTERAAEVANAAMISISDNVNKMGSSAESVQLAFQGFAKQQYMLLDNLKLGYGGTKTEMERLLKDAKAITGVKYDINNLADVYTAIGVIQEKLGIAGTTAKEASTTISGSAATMKAAWQNVLTAISGGGDLDRAINNLVDSISTYFKNIVPVVERSLQGIWSLIEKVAPKLVKTVAKSLINAIPSLINAIYEMILGAAAGIYEGIRALFSEETEKTVEQQAEKTKETTKNQKKLTSAVKETNKALKGSLASFDEINTISQEAEENNESQEIVLPQIENSGFETKISIPIEIDTTPIETFKQKMMELWDYLEPIRTAFSQLWQDVKPSQEFIDSFGWIQTDVFQPFLDYVTIELIPTIVGAFSNGWKSIENLWTTISEPLEKAWEEDIKPIVEDVEKWITDIVDQTSESFNYFSQKVDEYSDEISDVIEGIGAILSAIWSVVGPIISSVVGGIGNVLKTTIDFIFSVIRALGNFFAFFGNICNGIKSLIEGNTDESIKYFKEALANLVNIFVGIGNAIISVINNLWSLIFDAFKGTVNALGGLVKTVGEWIGQDWGWEFNESAPLIPMIPKYVPQLAKGTVVPPNKKFYAMLGDNTKEHEIVSPVSTIKQAVAEVLAQSNVGGVYNGRIEVPVIIDGREIARAVREAESNMGTQTVFGGFANAY